MVRLFLLAAALAIPLAGCDSGSVSADLSYDVQLQDFSSATVGSGEFVFDSAPRAGSNVSGDYTLTATAGGPIIPLVNTTGRFTGSFEGDSLVVRITPSTSDAGLRFAGIFSADAYSGSWSEITVAGPQPKGTFVADAD